MKCHGRPRASAGNCRFQAKNADGWGLKILFPRWKCGFNSRPGQLRKWRKIAERPVIIGLRLGDGVGAVSAYVYTKSAFEGRFNSKMPRNTTGRKEGC